MKSVIIRYKECIVLFLLVFFVYSSNLQGGLVWDDFHFIGNWPAIQQPLGHVSLLLTGDVPLGKGIVYRPVRSIIYAFSYALFGQNSLGYHIQADLLHAGCIVLVYLIIYELTKNRYLSFGAALVFGVHPVNVESVSWITASFDVWGYGFFLASLYFYLRSYQLKKYLKISQILAWLAYGSNEFTLMMPIILSILDAGLLKKSISLKKNFHKNKEYWWGVGIYAGLRFLFMSATRVVPPIFSSFINQTLLVLTIIGSYLKLFLRPYELSVNHVVGNISNFVRDDAIFPLHLQFIPNFQTLLGGLVVGWLIYLMVLKKQRYSAVTCLSLCSLVILIPVLQIIPSYSILYERYAYLSLFFGITAAAVMINNYWKYSQVVKITFSCLVVMIVILFSIKVIRQNQVWASDLSLWEYTNKQNSISAKVNNNLGLAYYREGKYQPALDTLEQSAMLNPNQPTYVFSAVNALLEQSQEEKLISFLSELPLGQIEYRQLCEGIKPLFRSRGQTALYNRISRCQMK